MGNALRRDRDKHLLTERLIVERDMNVRDVYDVLEKIGSGSITTTYRIRRKRQSETTQAQESDDAGSREEDNNDGHVSTDDDRLPYEVEFALKEIDLAKIDLLSQREFQNEIDILRRLDHPNIIRAYETYNYKSNDGKNMTGIVLELCKGGDLYSRAPYTEQEAGVILYKLVRAVHYMHERGIIHRDIKLENIMFESTEPDADIKLIDFGLSTSFLKNENFHHFAGTVYTMAPQIFMGYYTQAADMWSVGVVAFVLLSGEKPFWGKSLKSVGRSILKGDYSFNSPAWQSVSDEAKTFVTKLLQYCPRQRYTAEQALKDKWLDQFKPSSIDHMKVKGLLSQLHHMSEKSEFEKLAWLVAARKADRNEIATLREVFDELDGNHDGTISYAEFKRAMIDIAGCRAKYIPNIFRLVDIQNAGALDYTTFVAALLAARQGRLMLLPDGLLAEVYEHFDVDHSGCITRGNLQQILGNEVSSRYIDRMIVDVDVNKNGMIEYEELKRAFIRS